MRRGSWIVLGCLSLAAFGCFDPADDRVSFGTFTPTSTSAPPDSTTSSDGTTASGSATGPGGSSSGATSDGGTTSSDGTTMALDGTGTSDGSTGGEVTSSGSTAAGSSSGEGSSSEGSSSTGIACVPGPQEVEFESIGDFISQGDAWQSFTANTSGDVVRVDFYWNLSGTNDSFTLNLYEGEGTGGPLLHSEVFPGQGQGTFVGFDVINVLSTPVPITAGAIYTVQGVDTFGWQTATGAIAGNTSSLGAGQHKNIRVWVEPCE